MAVSERSAAPRSGAVLLADGEVQQHRSAAEAPEKRAEVSLPDERVSERVLHTKERSAHIRHEEEDIL